MEWDLFNSAPYLRLREWNDLACYPMQWNIILKRRGLWSQRMQKNGSSQGKKNLQKQFHLICVFPEKTSDEETVKNEVRSILHMELKHQLQQVD